MTLTDQQLEIISDAVEDYAILVGEDLADQCSEILDIIEAHFINNKK
jgi:hypothetical protein|tara:strand:- start:678 stop:818 length:141 start_codon:yes stop_codon:yes gene_type:complete